MFWTTGQHSSFHCPLKRTLLQLVEKQSWFFKTTQHLKLLEMFYRERLSTLCCILEGLLIYTTHPEAKFTLQLKLTQF